MFGRKKLYKFVYGYYIEHTTIISAKDEHQAIKRFKKEMNRMYFAMPSIVSVEEIQV